MTSPYFKLLVLLFLDCFHYTIICHSMKNILSFIIDIICGSIMMTIKSLINICKRIKVSPFIVLLYICFLFQLRMQNLYHILFHINVFFYWCIFPLLLFSEIYFVPLFSKWIPIAFYIFVSSKRNVTMKSKTIILYFFFFYVCASCNCWNKSYFKKKKTNTCSLYCYICRRDIVHCWKYPLYMTKKMLFVLFFTYNIIHPHIFFFFIFYNSFFCFDIFFILLLIYI